MFVFDCTLCIEMHITQMRSVCKPDIRARLVRETLEPSVATFPVKISYLTALHTVIHLDVLVVYSGLVVDYPDDNLSSKHSIQSVQDCLQS
jgi:hypothetical protein